MKLTALPLLLVPGMGQIRGGAPGLGVTCFVLCVAALNGWFLGSLLSADDRLPSVLGISAAALWLISLLDGLRRLARKPT